MTDIDWTAVVATWLANQPRRRVPLKTLGVLLPPGPRARRLEAAAEVRAAIRLLSAARLIAFVHHWQPIVGILDRDGLRSVATRNA